MSSAKKGDGEIIIKANYGKACQNLTDILIDDTKF